MMQALLERLSRLNPTAVFLAMAALVLGGLLLPRPYGGALLLALGAALAALLTVTWPYQTPRTRILRLVVLSVLIALAVLRLA